jgi:hypothetical protein
MRTPTKLVALVFAGALGASCAPIGVTGEAYVTTPSLALVGPDVYVVADYGQPVFFADGFYWLWYDGFWYRSHRYDGGWIHAVSVPDAVARIDRPARYARYHGDGRSYRPEQIVRDHRGPYQPVPRANRVPPQPPQRIPPPSRGAPPYGPRDHRR